MPPIATGVLGAFGVTPTAAIIAGLVAAALALGIVQARRAPPAAAAVPVTAAVD
jgi:hypothetical protein